jgi:hypothetical protein
LRSIGCVNWRRMMQRASRRSGQCFRRLRWSGGSHQTALRFVEALPWNKAIAAIPDVRRPCLEKGCGVATLALRLTSALRNERAPTVGKKRSGASQRRHESHHKAVAQEMPMPPQPGSMLITGLTDSVGQASTED